MPSPLLATLFLIASVLSASIPITSTSAVTNGVNTDDRHTAKPNTESMEALTRVYGGAEVNLKRNFNYFASINVPLLNNVKKSDLPPSLQPFYSFLPKSVLTRPPHICGATVISDQAVVTAAHCMFGSLSAFGTTFNYKFYPSLLEVSIGAKTYTTGFRIKVANVLQHRNYNPSSGTNDLALLILSRKIPKWRLLTAKIRKRPVNQSPQNMFMLGLGSIKNGDFTAESAPSALKRANVKFASGSSCQSSTDTVCTEPNGNEHSSACNSDSGGPLIIERKGDNGQVIHVIGVLKSITAANCENTNSKSVYTYLYPYRKAFYRNSITKALNPNMSSEYWTNLVVPPQCKDKSGFDLMLCS